MDNVSLKTAFNNNYDIQKLTSVHREYKRRSQSEIAIFTSKEGLLDRILKENKQTKKDYRYFLSIYNESEI